MNADEILPLLQLGESETLEFKTKAPSTTHEISRLLTSFANTRGGVVLFGVDDTGRPVGLGGRDASRITMVVGQVIESLFPQQEEYPSISMDVGSIEGSRLIMVRVPEFPESAKPIRLADGSVCRRRGNRSVVEAEPVDKPVLSAPQREPFKIFVSMSFRDEEEPALVDYFEAMKRAAEAVGVPYRIIRIDQEHGDYEIVAEIENTIRECDLVIADFTMQRPNVYYEAGIARGADVYTIRCARKDTEMHFDVAARRVTLYANATQLETALQRELRHAYIELEERRARRS